TAVGAAPDSGWAMRALLGTGDSLVALNRKSEALAAYTKLVGAVPVDAWRHGSAHAADRQLAGEAAYRGGPPPGTAGRATPATRSTCSSSRRCSRKARRPSTAP